MREVNKKRISMLLGVVGAWIGLMIGLHIISYFNLEYVSIFIIVIFSGSGFAIPMFYWSECWRNPVGD